MQRVLKHTYSLCLLVLILVASCDIKDDFALPLRRTQITSFEVEGQCDAAGKAWAGAVIDNDTRTVDVYVCDTVDLRSLKIKSLTASKNATFTLESGSSEAVADFPKQGVDSATVADVRVDFTRPVKFVLHTYQDYEWVVNVRQVVTREVSLSGQVGEAIIDPINQNVIVYVSTSQSLYNIKVEKFSIGGLHGTVSPDPTLLEACDFSRMTTFDVTYGWSREVHQWRLFVYQSEAVIGTTASVFARSVSATVSGDMQNGSQPQVEYRLQGNGQWMRVPEEQIRTSAANYTAEIYSLLPDHTYEYRVSAGSSVTDVQTFTTAPAQQLENGSFDDWHVTGQAPRQLYLPWKEGGAAYWDTGNHGATTVGASNSTSVTEGGRTFANLQSKFIVIKFAAGNIFTGEYLQTDGANGILSFGRPFQSFPTKLQFDYRYKTSPITRPADMSSKWEEAYGRYISKDMFLGLKNKPDSCNVYIALLGDQDEEEYKGKTYPYIIRTRPSNLHLFNTKSDNVIAYAQMTKGEDVNEWTTVTLDIDYRQRNRTPKYIVVVGSSSKYGDYFAGGDNSLLQLDNVKLLYE